MSREVKLEALLRCVARNLEHGMSASIQKLQARSIREVLGEKADRRPLGGALAMRVMQSDLYPKLDDVERADCDELVRQNLDWCKK